jgi:hypothetical protein
VDQPSLNYRLDYKMAEASDEALANALAWGAEDTRCVAANAELRLREHRAILRQAEAAEQAARAAERGAEATVKYATYTFWILVAMVVTTAAAIASLFRG